MTDFVFKNHTATSVTLDGEPSIVIDPGEEEILTEYWTIPVICSCAQLAALITQGSDSYQIDELTASQALTVLSSGIWNPGPVGTDGAPRVQIEQAEGEEKIYVTHNFCDKCTWYTNSERVTGETLSSSDGLEYSSVNTDWIDLNHGRQYNEDAFKADYLPVIYVNGTPATERTPFADSGGDFYIDYETGKVHFASSQTGNTVTADYSHATDSVYRIIPADGVTWMYERGAIDFTTDMVMNDSVIYQPYAYNPEDLPNKVPAGAAEVFKTVTNFWAEACDAPPALPAVGGATRGLSVPAIELPLKRQATKSLPSAYGAEIRVWLDSHQVFGGTYAALTLYGKNK